MFKMMYEIKMPYEYHAERKGSKYKIGDAFKNGGEFLESVAKCHRGLDYLVNPATNFDEGSDIESEHASVKSGQAKETSDAVAEKLAELMMETAEYENLLKDLEYCREYSTKL